MLRIKKIEIESFRSVKSLTLEPGWLCAFVGANNAGKSNILSALDLLLGHRYPTAPAMVDEDFYHCDPAAPLRVAAWFEYSEGGFANQELRIEFGTPPGGDELKLRYWGEGQVGRYPQRQLRDRFPLIRLGIDRGLRQHEPRNRWTLLGRLLLEINEQFKADPDRMREFTSTLDRLRDDVLASVPAFQELIQVLKEESARQLHLSVEDVSVELSLSDPWNFYRTLQFIVRECGMTMRADQMGMGLQSSLAIALLRAYARIARHGRAVIAIEEPELFLHPLAERQFYKLMRELSHPTEDGIEPLQILYTTHSANMVAFEHFDEIAVVRKEPDAEGNWRTTVRQATFGPLIDELRQTDAPDANAESVQARLRLTFDRSRTEGVFAAAVIVVEGASEELALPVYAAQLGYDLDALNIAVVNANGKTGIPLLLRAFDQFGIRCFTVFDGDAHKNDGEAKREMNVQILRLSGGHEEEQPQTGVGERHAVWREDFERQLRSEVADYTELEQEATAVLGKGKPAHARYCAEKLTARGEVPPSVRDLLQRAVAQVADAQAAEDAAIAEDESEEEIPF